MNAPQAANALAAHPVLAPGILRGFHLLEADAGTGKTWTIAGLVVRALIESGLTLERILVVTFTNAASDELGARIRERIGQLAQLLDDRLAGRDSAVEEPFCVAYAANLVDPAAALRALRVAIAQIDEAAVRTIHAYCNRIIVEHTVSIGVRLDGEADDRGKAWIERGVAEWWRAMVEDASQAALALLTTSGVSPADLTSRLAGLDQLPGAQVLPEAADWRALAEDWHRLRAELLSALERDADALLAWIAVKGNVDGRRYQRRHVDGWLAKLRAFVAGESAGVVLPDEIHRFTAAHFRGEEGKYRIPELGLVSVCDALEAMRPALADLRAQVAVAAWQHVESRRAALKQAEGGVDHDDLLRIVRDALADERSGETLAAALRERHPIALIDECQDTDALQWEIFRRIYRPHDMHDRACLILVGDPKQAIYAFRAADVYTYLEARGAGPQVHALQENQRSVRPLIEAVNALFDRDSAFLVPEIRFSPSAEGRKPRRTFEARAGLERAALTLMMLPGGDAAGMLDRASAADAAVSATVVEIAGLLDDGAVRLDRAPLRPTDVAVLVNSHREGSRVKQALAAAGIGAIEISRDSVLESRECDDLIRLVAAVADPADMGIVRSALATACAGFDAEALAALDQGADLARIVDALVAARRAWTESGPQAAMRRLILAWDIGRRLALLRDGERRLTNLMHLLDLLAAHAEPREGAHAALRWLGRMRADPSALAGEAGELRLESDEDLVRIVTVHKSKGLEFPIVFLPFAWSGREPRAKSLHKYHRASATGWTAVADLRADPDPDALRRAALEEHAEQLRSLYVALTRAQHRCYVCWGAASGAQFAPLAWLLSELDPSRQAPWRSNSTASPALTHQAALEGAQQWRDRGNALHPDAVGIVEIAAGDGDAARRVQRPAIGVEALQARTFAGRIPAPWIQTSFTALHAMLRRTDEAAALSRPGGERPDHDQAVDPAVPAGDRAGALADAEPAAGGSAPADAAADIRHDFPAGALAGVCLHGILENTDFARGTDRTLVSGWLARSGYDAAIAPSVTRWLDEVLAAPLPDLGGGPMRLGDLAGAATLREMEFLLPADGFDNARLLEAVAAHYPLDATAAHSRWSGYLRGFIDLIFARDGRHYIVDWKSNRLGPRADSYAAPALEGAIESNGYALQFCLYSLAVHRMLARRVADYDYERNFGGVHYVFLRGVAPQEHAGAGANGVYATRPPFELIQKLDRIFGGER